MLLFNSRNEQGPAFVDGMARVAALLADMERIHRGQSPGDLAGSEPPILDRWILASTMVPCLAGLSTGHPRLVGENRLIGTSDLWLLSEDRSWARTLSRWYRLGRPADHSDLNS
jgi:hypothetical protein